MQLGKMLKAKGHDAGMYQMMFVFAWIGGEIAGIVLGVLIAAGNRDATPVIVLFAYMGAACGAGSVFFMASSVKPRKTTNYGGKGHGNNYGASNNQVMFPPHFQDPYAPHSHTRNNNTRRSNSIHRVPINSPFHRSSIRRRSNILLRNNTLRSQRRRILRRPRPFGFPAHKGMCWRTIVLPLASSGVAPSAAPTSSCPGPRSRRPNRFQRRSLASADRLPKEIERWLRMPLRRSCLLKVGQSP
jgi:hypothetical protein